MYFTLPLDSDTDNDGIIDGDEIYSYLTDPLDLDTDNDGLVDGDEIFIYNTCATNNDTDGDGFLDGSEVESGTNPLDPSDHPSDDSENGLLGQNIALTGAIIGISILTSVAAFVKHKKTMKRRKEIFEAKEKEFNKMMSSLNTNKLEDENENISEKNIDDLTDELFS